VAAFTTVLCRTEDESAGRHKAFSAIIVPTDNPGWQLVRQVPTMGSVLGDHCEIRITNARVPKENLPDKKIETKITSKRENQKEEMTEDPKQRKLGI